MSPCTATIVRALTFVVWVMAGCSTQRHISNKLPKAPANLPDTAAAAEELAAKSVGLYTSAMVRRLDGDEPIYDVKFTLEDPQGPVFKMVRVDLGKHQSKTLRTWKFRDEPKMALDLAKDILVACFSGPDYPNIAARHCVGTNHLYDVQFTSTNANAHKPLTLRIDIDRNEAMIVPGRLNRDHTTNEALFLPPAPLPPGLAANDPISEIELARIAIEAVRPQTRLAAVDKLSDQILLARVVTQTEIKSVALAAMRKLTNTEAFSEVALKCQHDPIRIDALEKVTDEDVIAEFAIREKQWHQYGWRGQATKDGFEEISRGDSILWNYAPPAALAAVTR